MIYTAMGEPVEVVSGRCYDLLNPLTAEVPAYKVRSLNDPTWTRVMMMHELKADGGVAEIDAAFKAADEKHKAEKAAVQKEPLRSSELHPGVWFKLCARREEDGEREEKGTFDTFDAAFDAGNELLNDGWYEYMIYDPKGRKVQHVCGA